MMPVFRRPAVTRTARRATHARPTLEHLEAREVPAGTGFLQGTVYVDANANGAIDPADTPRSGAEVQLFLKPNLTTPFATTTTGPTGQYLFPNLDPGDYRIVDATPGFVPAAAGFFSQLHPASVTPQKAIDVTLVDTSAVTVYNAPRPSTAETITFTLLTANPQNRYSYVYQRSLTVSGGGLPAPVQFPSFCVNVNETISPPSTFGASTQPLDASLPFNAGRVGYLYNHYGTTPLSDVDGAALQMAIWELEYDASPDITAGNFVYGQSDFNDQAIRDKIQFYLTDSAGKSEAAIYLRAEQPDPNGHGMQSMIATGSFNLGIALDARIDIEKYVKPAETGGNGGEGLTPGFWKTHSEYGPAPLKGWPETGYDPDDSYNAVFGVSVAGSPTLLEALGAGGGGVNALLRHSTAALLNAANPNVDYAYTVAEVVAETRAAIDSGNPVLIEEVKNLFAAENEKGADLTPSSPAPATPTPGFGFDADDPTGPVVPVGSTVQFTFVVTNPGQVPLIDVVVLDDNQTPEDFGDDFEPTPVEVEVEGTNVYVNVGDDNQDGQLDPGEVWLYTWSTTVTAGQHTNTGRVVGTPVDSTGEVIGPPVTDEDAANWLGFVSGSATGSISGSKFFDADADGVWDSGESRLPGWTIYVDLDNDGTLDGGEPSAVTNEQGAYTIGNLPAGVYTVREVVRAGWIRTTADYAQTATGDSRIVVAAGQTAQNVNFGNFQQHLLMAGQTATIGFWQNKNGRAVIESLNGSRRSTALGGWLATTFPNMYGGTNSMAGKTNVEVADYFVTLFKASGKKLEAQVLATALAVYVTDIDLAVSATVSQKFGFIVDTLGTGAALYNVGGNGAAFGVANNSVMTVLEILEATNMFAKDGDLWGNTEFIPPALYQTYRNMGNIVYTGINEGGDIP